MSAPLVFTVIDRFLGVCLFNLISVTFNDLLKRTNGENLSHYDTTVIGQNYLLALTAVHFKCVDTEKESYKSKCDQFQSVKLIVTLVKPEAKLNLKASLTRTRLVWRDT